MGPAADQGSQLPGFWDRGLCRRTLVVVCSLGRGLALYGVGKWAAPAGSEVQRCLGCPSLLGHASDLPGLDNGDACFFEGRPMPVAQVCLRTFSVFDSATPIKSWADVCPLPEAFCLLERP